MSVSARTCFVKTYHDLITIGARNAVIFTFYSAWYIHGTPPVIVFSMFYNQSRANEEDSSGHNWLAEQASTWSISVFLLPKNGKREAYIYYLTDSIPAQ